MTLAKILEEYADSFPAGYGPISDGIPLPIGREGASEKEIPPPPRQSSLITDFDKTVRMRRPQ